MTSTQRLIAIIVIWLVVGVLGAAVVPGVAILRFLDAPTIVIIYVGMAAAAAAATWFITRSKPAGG